MKNSIFFLVSVFLFACSSKENNATVHNVIEKFCAASSIKDEKQMTSLVYPKLFNDNLDKGMVQYMFMRQMQATERFKITNIQFENEPKLIYTFKNEEFFVQSYTSDTDIKFARSAAEGFSQQKNNILKIDPNAVVDENELSLKFNQKRKIILVKNEKGTFILPEIFVDYLEVPNCSTS